MIHLVLVNRGLIDTWRSVTEWLLFYLFLFLKFTFDWHIFWFWWQISVQLYRSVCYAQAALICDCWRVFYDNRRNSRALTGEFLLSISGQTHEFIIFAMRQQTRADNLTICYRTKTNWCQFFIRLSCYRQWIVKVVCGSTATLTVLWRNSSSITGQRHDKLTSIC